MIGAFSEGLVCMINLFELPFLENQQSAYAKPKTQISFAVTAKLISVFVFATWIVQFLYFLNLKLSASSHLLCLYSRACVGPVRRLIYFVPFPVFTDCTRRFDERRETSDVICIYAILEE